MRELTSNEIDLVSAGPSAINPLALVDQRTRLLPMAAPAVPGTFPTAGAFAPNDSIATTK